MTYISNKDYKYRVALSDVSGARTWNKFGYNPDVDTASEEIIAAFGGTFTIMTGADQLDVVSSSANDTNTTGSGARQILIEGIDGSGAYLSETVNMTGTSTATTTGSFLGVNRVYVISSGSSDYNEGDITITDNGASFGTQAYIPATQSVTQQCIFHTEAGKTFLTDWLIININKISGGGSPRVTIKGYSYSRVVDTTYEVFRKTIDTAVENTVELTPSQPFVIGGQEVLYFTADTNTNNTVVSMRFSGIHE